MIPWYFFFTHNCLIESLNKRLSDNSGLKEWKRMKISAEHYKLPDIMSRRQFFTFMIFWCKGFNYYSQGVDYNYLAQNLGILDNAASVVFYLAVWYFLVKLSSVGCMAKGFLVSPYLALVWWKLIGLSLIILLNLRRRHGPWLEKNEFPIPKDAMYQIRLK